MKIKYSRAPRSLLAAAIGLAVFLSASVAARPPTQVKSAVNRSESPVVFMETLVLPFAFSSESTEFVIGVGGMRKGFHQEQMLIGGAVYGGEEHNILLSS